MSTDAKPLVAEAVFEGSSPVILAYIRDEDKKQVALADVQSIAYHVEDQDDVKINSAALTPKGTYFFDDLRHSPSWPHKTGYNFRFQVPTTDLPAGKTASEFHVTITTTSNTKLKFAVKFPIVRHKEHA